MKQLLSLLVLTLLLPVPWATAWRDDANSKVECTLWPEADQLFHSDPRWLGGDDGSLDLGDGRVLWLFGDSLAAKKLGATRRQSKFIRNSIAIQTGYDPSHATIKFYSALREGNTSDFIPPEGTNWFWPLHGIRLGDRLLLFFVRMTRDPNKDSLGFQSVGWNAFMVDNPTAEPSKWKPHKLDGFETTGKMLVGISVIREGEYVYAFVLNDVDQHAYLLRWPVSEAAAGHLSAPQWWCGVAEGWQSSSAHRQIVIRNAGSDFSVQRNPHDSGFIEVNSDGFGASVIVFRRAARLEGAWSEPQKLFRPPESDASDAFVYNAKSHAELLGADLVLTYNTNSFDDRMATDMSIYFPRFVRVTLNKDLGSGESPTMRMPADVKARRPSSEPQPDRLRRMGESGACCRNGSAGIPECDRTPRTCGSGCVLHRWSSAGRAGSGEAARGAGVGGRRIGLLSG